MYGYFAGYSDNSDIKHCPKCGSEIGTAFGDGSAVCDECLYRFAVIEVEVGDDDD